MKHDDFNSIEIDFVLEKVLEYGTQVSGAKSVHWLSSYGLERVMESNSETWNWAFSTADLVGKHVVSRPAADMFEMFPVWRRIAALYPRPWKGTFQPEWFAVASHEYFAYPVTFDGAFQGILLCDGVAKSSVGKLTKDMSANMAVGAKYVAFAYQQLGAKGMSYIDEVTGLYNQRYLPMVLEHEIERTRRDGAQFSLLFLDIDYFKMVNDGRGHWVGSRLLLELAKILRGQVRACDYCFRYGGDEFIVLLGNSNAENSKKVAERIRKSVEGNTFSVEGHNLNLTVSIGLASYPEHAQTASGLIQIADQAMYYGKRKSRNIVFVAS